MAPRLTVIFFIFLCLLAGAILTIAPWAHDLGLRDWGDNFLLLLLAQKTGLDGLQRAVASGWVRGAVTGIGLLNIAMAFWEVFHFNESVRELEGYDARAHEPRVDARGTIASLPTADAFPTTEHAVDVPSARATDHVPHHGRRDE